MPQDLKKSHVVLVGFSATIHVAKSDPVIGIEIDANRGQCSLSSLAVLEEPVLIRAYKGRPEMKLEALSKERTELLWQEGRRRGYFHGRLTELEFSGNTRANARVLPAATKG